MRKALAQTNRLGIGEIAFSGREHLVAIRAPPDPKQKGLMLYTLRYENELRDPKFALSDTKEASVDEDEISLARQLINGRASKFDLSADKDDYEAAVKKLVDAKRRGKPLPAPEPEPEKAKVVSIVDALRRSLARSKNPRKADKKTARRRAA